MNPILIEVPESFETDRLLIRMPRKGDGEAVHAAIEASLEELKPWMEFAHLDQTVDDVEVNLRQAIADFILRTNLRYLVFEKESGRFIASSGLQRINWSIPKFEIGYWAVTNETGKGYVTEAVEGLSRVAFSQLGAKRIEIRCDSDNHASRRVAEKAGFRLEAVLEQEGLRVDGGGTKDTCVFVRLT
ncbi:GNAT family N-acetyltransferase [Exiguobacterium flavidum]|uniref:GNAT family N-acetyltransferase n=1 Tax=Exiguobacterium flavidum TaxID=2184695 RepID=UPI000DF7FC7C|nr:GNAT family N-acetyltransferase [Exiguobacterium flavidum]